MIIGFAGRKYAGKDTAAKVFEASGWTHLKMADGIKCMLHALLSYQGADEVMVHRMLEGDLKETPSPYLNGATPRYAMQTLGTEWGRAHMGEDFWAGIFINAAEEHEAVVCSDVRFHNEVEIIRDAGGRVYRINRPGTTSNDAHASEAQIDELNVDGELANTADDAEEFAFQVAAIMGPSIRV